MHKSLRINKEFAALIPPLAQDEYNQLEQNILVNGCRDPIALWQGKIVDGHNRYRICTKHGIKFETVKLRFPCKDAAKIWILENQLGRRNLTDAMRIELAARKIEYMGLQEYINLNIARAAKLSKRTVQRYMRIKNNGDEELLAKVMAGEYKIGKAHRQIGKAHHHMEIITTTAEEIPFTPPTEEESNFYCLRAIMGNIRQIKSLLLLLVEHRRYYEELSDDVQARLGVCLDRVERLYHYIAINRSEAE